MERSVEQCTELEVINRIQLLFLIPNRTHSQKGQWRIKKEKKKKSQTESRVRERRRLNNNNEWHTQAHIHTQSV